MSDLTAFRDHARRMATATHRPDCLVRPNLWSKPVPHPGLHRMRHRHRPCALDPPRRRDRLLPPPPARGDLAVTRRLHHCLACPGKTRHRAVCGPCRRRGVTVTGEEIIVPIVAEPRWSIRLLTTPPANPAAPTIAELQAGVDLTRFLTAKDTR